MFFRDVIDLISSTETVNTLGNVVTTDTITTVFADRKGVKQSEFYQANAAGFKPELVFTIRAIDYDQQERIKYNDIEYNVIRTYDKDGEMIELVCGGLTNGTIEL